MYQCVYTPIYMCQIVGGGGGKKRRDGRRIGRKKGRPRGREERYTAKTGVGRAARQFLIWHCPTAPGASTQCWRNVRLLLLLLKTRHSHVLFLCPFIVVFFLAILHFSIHIYAHYYTQMCTAASARRTENFAFGVTVPRRIECKNV